MNRNTIYCGDSIELLAEWPEACVDLIFADPPYNIGYLYDNYADDKSDDDYVQWCRTWMAACGRALTPTGSFYLAIGDDYAAQLRLVGSDLGLHLRNWIVWYYSFGQNTKAKFCRSHTHILYFSKDERRFTFNDRALRFPSARHTEYQDLRASPLGRLPDDVWDFPRVCGTFKERDGYHGCQMPEALLTRIILASSNPGEVVLDPFLGSGTTAAVAKRLGRDYVGIDLSPEYVTRCKKRLDAVTDESHAKPILGTWPALHTEMLAQLYRETGVSVDNLLPNEVALRVISACLKNRTGTLYEVEEITAHLGDLARKGNLPKLPNDARFRARKHVTTEGKRYVRHTKRQVKKRSEKKSIESNLFSAS